MPAVNLDASDSRPKPRSSEAGRSCHYCDYAWRMTNYYSVSTKNFTNTYSSDIHQSKYCFEIQGSGFRNECVVFRETVQRHFDRLNSQNLPVFGSGVNKLSPRLVRHY
jgi:lipopolysaccharide assembly outer membrane protein LptD (OstA)